VELLTNLTKTDHHHHVKKVISGAKVIELSVSLVSQ